MSRVSFTVSAAGCFCTERITAPGVVARCRFRRRGKLHLRHLFEQDRLVVLCADGEVLQVGQAVGAADVADQVLARALLEKAAAGVGGVIIERGFELLERHPQCLHLRQGGLYAILLDLAADRNHLRHARNGEQARAHHPVRIFAHLHRVRMRRVRGQRDQHDLAHDRGDGPHLRRDALGKLLFYERHALGDLLAVAEDLRAPVKLDEHDRQRAGHRAHAVTPGMPFIAVSIGKVTSCSTSSGAMPPDW
jgi:hypothetical protein